MDNPFNSLMTHIDESPLPDIKWFTIKSSNTDTEQEVKEVREAQDHQVRLGIIKTTHRAISLDRKYGPNERCPCQSGKKFKVCHGRMMR